MEFRPANDYEGLLRQARALASLVSNIEGENSGWRRRCEKLEVQVKLADTAAIEAERSTNARLTDDLEAAERRIASLEERNEALDLELHALLAQWNSVFVASGARCHGTLAGHVAQMRIELERLRAQAGKPGC